MYITVMRNVRSLLSPYIILIYKNNVRNLDVTN